MPARPCLTNSTGVTRLVEQTADALFGVREANRFRQQLAHTEHLELLEASLGRNRDRIGDGELPDRRLGEALDRRAREQRMRGACVDVARAELLERMRCLRHGASRVD